MARPDDAGDLQPPRGKEAHLAVRIAMGVKNVGTHIAQDGTKKKCVFNHAGFIKWQCMPFPSLLTRYLKQGGWIWGRQ